MTYNISTMKKITAIVVIVILSQITLTALGQNKYYKAVEFTNGNWLIKDEFKSLTVYSVNGVFSFHAPEIIDTVVNLENDYIIPPFAEAHNHNIGTGVVEWDKRAIDNFLHAGVLYVKIQGNLPVNEAYKKALEINKPGALEVQFAQGNITASNGHPIKLIHDLHGRGYYKGNTIESLYNSRYFTMDDEGDIIKKWPFVQQFQPDFIKILLVNSDQYEKNKSDTSIWYKGLNPDLIPTLVLKAHQNGLRISAHINNSFDFHHALINNVDEIAHMPRMISGLGYIPISADDAKLAAKNKTFIITTLAISLFQGGTLKKEDIPLAKKLQTEDLKTLYNNAALLAIGSDDPSDTSIKEAMYIKNLNVFDNLTLLKIWTENTPKTIFPNRKIGSIEEGYEATFLALEGNPIQNFENVSQINLKFKQGYFIK
jgi:hypothetical protein